MTLLPKILLGIITVGSGRAVIVGNYLSRPVENKSTTNSDDNNSDLSKNDNSPEAPNTETDGPSKTHKVSKSSKVDSLKSTNSSSLPDWIKNGEIDGNPYNSSIEELFNFL